MIGFSAAARCDFLPLLFFRFEGTLKHAVGYHERANMDIEGGDQGIRVSSKMHHVSICGPCIRQAALLPLSGRIGASRQSGKVS